MQEIIDMGIPVVNFDVDVACEGIYKVTGDNYDMGYQSAKYIVEKAGEAAHIAVLDVPSSGSVCELRKQGFYDYLAEINYDTSNIQEFQLESFARDDGLKNAADILEKMPQVDAFYSMDDETSIGTIQAMNDAGRTEIKAITGGGGCQEYFQIIASEEGQAIGAASALYSPAMIQDAIKVAIKLMNGEEAEPVIVIPTTIVSAENVADHLDPSNNVY
jgi:ribose transport system substrate-binding protein